MASITTRTGKGSPLTNAEVDSNFTELNTELGLKEVAANKGVAGGYASLDSSGKVPSAQLPSYVDDVVEGANLAAFPGSGETGKIYVALDTNKTYRWSGSAYVEISASPGSTDAVTEGSTNLYFTNTRTRAALSASGSLSYNSTTGVFSYTQPTNVSAFTNDSGYITSSALSPYLTSSTAASTYQTTLVSGTSIKTVNGQSVLGSGNIQIDGGVTSFNTRTGAVTLSSGDVTTALGYTPYNSSNPSGYITSSSLSSYLSLTGGTMSGGITGIAPSVQSAITGVVAGNAAFRTSETNVGTTAGYIPAIGQTSVYTSGYRSHMVLGSYRTASGWGGGPFLAWGGSDSNATEAWVFNTGGSITHTGGRTFLDSSNYSSYALPLSGGTITGTALQVGTAFAYDNPGGWNANIVAAGSTHARFRLRATSFSGSGDRETYLWLDNSVSPATGLYSNASTFNFNGSIGTVQVAGNTVLHAGNYTSYSPSLTGSGASGTWGISITGYANSLNNYYTADDWLRAVGDAYQFKIYGNTRSVIFRTDGVSNPYGGGADYAFNWFYGGGAAGNRIMLLQTDGNLWTNAYGWLHDGFVRTTNNSSLNSDSRNSRGVTRLYRRDDNSDYSVQTYWTGSRWYLAGYAGDGFHAGCEVEYAASAGTASTANSIDGWGFVNTGSNTSVNADNIDSNGISYYTAGVPNFSGNSTDGALYSQAYSGSWQHQIAGDYRSGQIALRGKNSGTWQAWRTVLDSGNYSSYALPLSGGTMSGPIRRSAHAQGFLEGSYNNVGGNASNTNPIYTIGSAYNPTDSSLANMYGIGFSHPNLWGGGNRTDDWGLYVVAAGTVMATIGAGSRTAWFANQVFADGSFRSPIFYDSNNTAYYTDPASTSRVNEVQSDRTYGFTDIRSPIYYDYNNTGYYVDPAATTSLRTVGDWRADSSGWTGEFAGKIQYHSSNWYFQYAGSALFRNSGGSNVTSIDSAGNLTASGNIRSGGNVFTDANYGYGLVGVYTSTRYQGVFAMGDSYKLPADGSGTGSLYGIAWSHPNAGGIAGNLNTHGALIMENGTFLAALSGSIRSRDDMRTPIFYDNNNTGYYLNPDGGSYLYSLTLAGGAYFRPSTWIQMDGSYGMYWPNHYGVHFYPNASSTYTQLQIDGSKNSYSGMYISHSAVNGMMYDSGGNGGVYREANGRWYFYYLVGNNCMGINTSTTSSSYGLYVSGGVYSTGNVVAYSDARRKTNVVTVGGALDKVAQLRGVYYTRIPGEEDEKTDPNRREIGVIAQEVNEILPEVVTYAADIDEYGVQYGNFAGLFIEAIKELKSQVATLSAEVAELRGRSVH
jgi:hypothetical protein